MTIFSSTLGGGVEIIMKYSVMTKNTRKKRLVSKLLNRMLLISFIPTMVVGVIIYIKSRYYIPDNMTIVEQVLHSYPIISMWCFVIIGFICGGILHELCHGIACRAYGGRVHEYGFVIDLLLGFYTLMDTSNITSRLKRIQILAAGVEGNVLFAGCLLQLTGLLPGIRIFLFTSAVCNMIMVAVNMLAIRKTDGLERLKLLVKEAEKWAGIIFDWYDTYGICNGHWWIRVSTF